MGDFRIGAPLLPSHRPAHVPLKGTAMRHGAVRILRNRSLYAIGKLSCQPDTVRPDRAQVNALNSADPCVDPFRPATRRDGRSWCSAVPAGIVGVGLQHGSATGEGRFRGHRWGLGRDVSAGRPSPCAGSRIGGESRFAIHLAIFVWPSAQDADTAADGACCYVGLPSEVSPGRAFSSVTAWLATCWRRWFVRRA